MPASIQMVKKFYPDVTRVKDATENLTIEVTPRDVKAGARKKHAVCAMARACKRALNADGAIVSLGIVYLIDGRTATRYRVPQSLSREIISFDRGGTFEPGEYDLRKPERPNKKGHSRGKVGGYKASHHMTRRVRKSLVSMAS